MYHTSFSIGAIFLNLYLNDLLLFLNEIGYYIIKDNLTTFVYHKNLAELLEKLERNSELAINWFENNYMKLNTNKSHILMSGHQYEHQWPQIDR